MFLKLPPREEGQGLVEYALILVLVAIVVIAILLLLGPAIGQVFSRIVFHLTVGGGPNGVTVTFNGTPSIVETPSGLGCQYTASVPVSATQGGLPANGVAISGFITLLNGGGNNMGTIGIQGTATNGNANLTGSVTLSGCSSQTGDITVPGAGSQSTTIN
jgi:pilus assembly protein Flp/PilA